MNYQQVDVYVEIEGKTVKLENWENYNKQTKTFTIDKDNNNITIKNEAHAIIIDFFLVSLSANFGLPTFLFSSSSKPKNSILSFFKVSPTYYI